MTREDRRTLLPVFAIVLLALAVIVVLVLLANFVGGGMTHDARVVATKQAGINECSVSGGYPAIDPNYPLAVYCSRTPFSQR